MTQGEYLKQCRKEIGLKQEDTADLIGLSRPSYGNIENDRQFISIESLIQLSTILGFYIPDYFEKVHGFKMLTTSAKEAKIKRLEKQRESLNEQINKLIKNDSR